MVLRRVYPSNARNLRLLKTMPAKGDHSLRPSARVRGLNLFGSALKVFRTQSAMASGSGRCGGVIVSGFSFHVARKDVVVDGDGQESGDLKMQL